MNDFGDVKICTCCKEPKPISQFHRTSRKYTHKKSGEALLYTYHHAKCKKCRNDQKEEWIVKKNKKNRKKVKA